MLQNLVGGGFENGRRGDKEGGDGVSYGSFLIDQNSMSCCVGLYDLGEV